MTKKWSGWCIGFLLYYNPRNHPGHFSFFRYIIKVKIYFICFFTLNDYVRFYKSYIFWFLEKSENTFDLHYKYNI